MYLHFKNVYYTSLGLIMAAQGVDQWELLLQMCWKIDEKTTLKATK